MITILAHEAARRILEAVAIAVLTAAGTKLITYGIDKGIKHLDEKTNKKKSKDKEEINGNV